MSTTIDQRVVEMRFDNKQFESATAASMSTIEKLKKSLNFTGASKGLEDVSSAAKKVDMSGLSSAVDSVKLKFSALQVAAVTVFANITNSAFNAGKKIVSALTIDPIMTGFHEYETQINAIQTILANTSNAGTTLGQVNAALDELNTYADKTIYNFTEMTRNIGTFTAAGVDLDTSVSAIKGIANLAAVSGSSSAQASTAMYQLSQAIAAGRVSLEDWNSVVNAGMGGKVFQDALKNTAKAMGIVVDETKSFRESISATGGNKSWLTSDVLLNTLKQFTGDLNDAELAAMGFNEAQIASIQQMAVTANDAATKVKTVTQLWDTLKESAQSGWTQTWEILIGDFGEAKELLTEVSDTFGEIIGKSSDARNTLLYDALSSNWKKITDGITEAGLSAEEYENKVSAVAKKQGVDVDAMVKDYGSLEAAFKNGAISSTVLSDALISMTGTAEENQKKLTELTGKYTSARTIMEALTKAGYDQVDQQNILDKVNQGQAVTLNDLTDAQLRSLGYTEKQIESIRQLSSNLELSSGSLQKFIDNVSKPMGRENLIDALRISFRSLVDVFGAVHDAWVSVFPPTTSDQILGITESVKEFALAIRPSAETLDKIGRSFKGLFSVFSLAKQALSALISPIGELLGGVGDLGGGLLDLTASFGDWLVSVDQAAKANGVFTAVSGTLTDFASTVRGVASTAVDNLGNGISKLGDIVSSVFGFIKDQVSDVFGWIRDNLDSGDVFAGLAGGGVYVLFKKFGGLLEKVGDIFEKIKGIFDKGEGGGKFSEILESVHGSLESFQEGIKVASLVGIATAVMLLTSALKSIAALDAMEVAGSLVAIRLMIASLNSGFKSMSKTLSKFNPKGVIKASIAMIGIATAINILASAMQKLSGLSWGEIAKGLVTIGVSMAALSASIKVMGNSSVTLRTSVALLAIAQACKMLASALQEFGGMQWDEIARGLVAMGGALAELTAVTAIMGKVGGGKSLLGATSLLIAVQSLYAISENLEKLGNLSWEQIGKGLAAMGGALAELTASLSILSAVGGFGALLGGTAILIASQSLYAISENLEKLGNLSWEQIGHGLTAMGGALAEIGIVTGALGKLAGFSGLLGAGAILITVQGLGDIASALQEFGSMAWDEIGRGLTAMGGALAEIGVVTGALGMLAGFSGLLGAGTILLAVQGLGDLADAMQKFGSMQWDEIGRGLVAMGGAMAEVAVISGLTGALGGIAGLVGAGTLALAVSGLDQLATAFQKFGSMSWDEIGRGLTAMGTALGEVAIGGLLNTFSGFGAAAIAEMAEPLGALADSIKKWKDVTVPENLGTQIGSLADGVKAFNFAGWGADTLTTVAPGLGQLAGAVQKWNGVTLSEEIGTQLSSLAAGVSAFSFAFVGSWSISSLIEPLANLAGTMSKWNGVTIPENIDTGLQKLADGVGAFNFSFFGGWSIDGIVQPLSDLAGAVKKWNGISISGVGDGLKSLASGLESLGSVSMKNLASNIESAADRVSQAISSMLSGMSNTVSTKKTEIVASFNALMTESINVITSKQTTVITAVSGLMSQFSNAITSKSTTVVNSFEQMMDKSVQSVRSKYSSFVSAGSYIVEGLAKGIRDKQAVAVAQAREMARAVEQASKTQLGIKSPSKVFQSIGAFTVAGLVKGIFDKLPNAKKTATELGSTLINATQDVLETHSPSVVMTEIGHYVVQGLAEGISSDMSAEEAASQKAQNIISAFETELQKWDASTTTANLEYQLWEKLNPNASAAEKTEAELSFLNKKLSNQTSVVQATQAKYQAMVDQFGKSSTQATEIYDELLQAQIDLAAVVEEINNIRSETTSSNIENLDRYSEIFNSLKERMDIEGYTLEQITQMAADAAGVNFDLTSSDLLNVKDVVDSAISGITVEFNDSVKEVETAAKNIGTTVATAVSDAVVEETPTVVDNVTTMVQNGAESIEETKSMWVDGAATAVDGLVEGVEKEGSRFKDAIVNMAQAAYAAAMAVFNSSDVSQPTITPVLDLSNVTSGLSNLDTSVSTNKAQSTGSAILSSQLNNKVGNVLTEDDVKKASISFTQNNYSPKSLSNVEIYRQTKNQFSAFERMVKT